MRLNKMKLPNGDFEIAIKAAVFFYGKNAGERCKRKDMVIKGVYMTEKWILCPVCGNKTRDRIREDSVLKNYPLYCPKCKHETLIEVTNLKITAITEPDAKTQSR